MPHNQTELAESYGITKQTMNNYMRMASNLIDKKQSTRSVYKNDRYADKIFRVSL